MVNDEFGINEYIYAFYFTTVTMATVGYGDFTPKSIIEVVICIVFIIMTCGCFAYYINKIG